VNTVCFGVAPGTAYLGSPRGLNIETDATDRLFAGPSLAILRRNHLSPSNQPLIIKPMPRYTGGGGVPAVSCAGTAVQHVFLFVLGVSTVLLLLRNWRDYQLDEV
jgi:hypothetical protein